MIDDLINNAILDLKKDIETEKKFKNAAAKELKFLEDYYGMARFAGVFIENKKLQVAIRRFINNSEGYDANIIYCVGVYLLNKMREFLHRDKDRIKKFEKENKKDADLITYILRTINIINNGLRSKLLNCFFKRLEEDVLLLKDEKIMDDLN